MVRGAASPTVSVVVPTYQRRDSVLLAIDSVRAQQCGAVEVLVVDDGSTDGTCDAIAARHGDAVRVLRQPNLGPSAARNAACRVARGEVIAFLDSDNQWRPDHLGVLADLWARHPAAVLVGTTRDYRIGREPPAEACLADLAADLLLDWAAVGYLSSVSVRRNTFLATGGFDEQLRYGEDTDFYIRLALEGPFALISGTTIELGTSPDSLVEEAYRTGGFLGLLEHTADTVLAALERSPRADAGSLRAAARARRATGVVLMSLAGDASPETVRRQLAQIRHWVPDIDEVAAVLSAAEWVMPRADEPGWRRRVATALLRATP